MNVLWLKYATEVAKCGSISAAAKNLYMEQPNLSRAIKDLEDSLGVKLFDRTVKGVSVTPRGEEFLRYAESILRQMDDIERLYKYGGVSAQRFSVSVPRASYISEAFTNFSKNLSRERPVEVFYKETNAVRAINNILHADYKLGIIRYAVDFESHFDEMLKEEDLHSELITEFTYGVIMNRCNPLADKSFVTFSDLKGQIEIAHADPYVPSLPLSVVKKSELPDDVDKRIFVFERASQFELLGANGDMYMWVSPVPEELLRRYNLVFVPCADNKKVYRDVLIYRNSYKLTELDKAFIESLFKSRNKFIHSPD